MVVRKRGERTGGRSAGRRSDQGTGSPMPKLTQKNLVWVFGAGRTGSTWLSEMMSEMPETDVWFEPYLGELFDPERLLVGVRPSGGFVFAKAQREAWLRATRVFVITTARARFPEVPRTLVVKEPHGSAGAPILSAATPASRLILLVREPRDAVASALYRFHLHGPQCDTGGWGMYRGPKTDADGFVERAAREYARHVMAALAAHNTHKGPKTLLRYEDLRKDTLSEMRRAYGELSLPFDESNLERAATARSFENIPDSEKGVGKVARRAGIGAWKQDLTPAQAETVSRLTVQVSEEFYPEWN